ncbi:unnamed protein product [Brachionus calyciflorus]|uniref:LIM and calponin homology domains-containing protein n=1 Tax=Brachionus calyciflorus TaxID=104777 RepID=A0A813M5P1_9BILA|nr:unnamed protein product [Brachionus calyciflorus]
MSEESSLCEKSKKSIVANLVNSINLMTNNPSNNNKVQRSSSSRCSSPASSLSSTSLSTKQDILDNKLNDNKRTLSSSSLASSVSVSSSSNLFSKTNTNQTSDYVEDSMSVGCGGGGDGGGGVFDDSKFNLKLNHVCRSNRSSISTSTTNNLDDFLINDDNNFLMVNYDDNNGAPVCNLSKLKIKKEEHEFNNMILKCQNWIETVTNKKFAYPNDFRKSLENGVILCELLNILKPDCIRRINRHSAPIAGIDNLTQFLKACQEHFNLCQANLFDITDLEDLVKRRGTNLNNINNSTTNKFENSNHLLIDEEQQRRLKKVVHTISWLSQKANKFGIPLPYYFDITNLNNSVLQANNSKHILTKTKITSFYSNTSLNQYSSSSASSSLSSSSSFITSSNNNSAVSLSVIIGPGDSIKLSTPKSNCLLKQKIERKEIACSSSSSYSDEISQSSSCTQSRFECIDDCAQKLEHTNKQVEKMSYIYKTTNLKNDKDTVDNDTFSSPSPSTSSSYSQNLNSELHNSNIQNKSQEDLRLIDANCSPISSTSVASPRFVQTQNLTNNNSNLPTPNSNPNPKIPTRYFDRRVSTSVMDSNPYKFNVNYSAAGQQLAKKAHEQLKTVEKSKELKKLESEKKNNATVVKKKNDYINNDDESLNDDWQNRVDDWKKRRREKQKLPVKTRSFEEDEPQNNRSDRKRINPFEASQYYIMPLNEESTTPVILEISKSKNEPSDKNVNPAVKESTEPHNTSINQSLNESQNELDESQNVQYVYIEKLVDITRPDNYTSRGFGFLLNSGYNSNKSELNEPINVLINDELVLVNECYAQIVVVEPDTLADKSGLKKGDLVIEINESCTNNLTNEQLRKIMRQRLQLNSISMKILSQQRQGQNFENIVNVQHNENKIEQISDTFSEALSPSISTPTSGDSTPCTTSSLSTNNPLSKNPNKQVDYHQIVAPKPFKKSLTSSSNQSENMNTESLIEKRKTQLSLILNWTLSTNLENKKESECVPEKQISLISSVSSSISSLEDIARKNDQIISSSISKNSEEQNLYDSLSYLKPTDKSKEIESESNKLKSEKFSNDDTDHDNDDDDLLQSPRPPPIPTTEPPPLPSFCTKKSSKTETTENPQALEIKKVLFDNMKSIENWKQEQEMLMKRKYEEEQKRIEESLKLDLDRVKEEEIQRREQERLKLEKEKIRLQELEIKQREEELQQNLEETKNRLASPISKETLESKSEVDKSVSVKKDDLNALIEKIYTEESDEPEFQKLELPRNEPIKQPRPNPPQKLNNLISTKTLPVAMAAINQDEKIPLTSLIDTNTKHQVIKQVHDSMDHLKNELLHKGMNKYAEDVDLISKNLEENRQKQEEMERIRLEQETIRLEKERIEHEKEKLRLEAEQLRKEREFILMNSPLISPTSNEFTDYNLYKTNLQADIRRPGNKSISPTRKHINIVSKNQILPSGRNIEEIGPRIPPKISHLKNPNFQMNLIDQKMRRSVPSLINEPKNINPVIPPRSKNIPVQQRLLIPKPPYQQKISQSHKVLNQPQIYQNSPTQEISLSQKCSSCNQILGQGSAMWIEKLSLAFHLKCFRCSVCNVPLGNGKEGTDVRVSGANRLHCNNCFSNDLGLRLSAV